MKKKKNQQTKVHGRVDHWTTCEAVFYRVAKTEGPKKKDLKSYLHVNTGQEFLWIATLRDLLLDRVQELLREWVTGTREKNKHFLKFKSSTNKDEALADERIFEDNGHHW